MRVFAYAVVFAFVASAAAAQDVPKFYSETFPSHALDEAMALEKALGSDEAALDAKTRQLISLAVAAQIPCEYCIHAHMRLARSAGATEAEVREAVAAAANVRHWSTVLNGMDYDVEAFEEELNAMAPLN